MSPSACGRTRGEDLGDWLRLPERKTKQTKIILCTDVRRVDWERRDEFSSDVMCEVYSDIRPDSSDLQEGLAFQRKQQRIMETREDVSKNSAVCVRDSLFLNKKEHRERQ
ncbi:hypothetical protein NDU88_001986 [Pleurodeles waltl]|uniref:Uncharacterized protein n=1 Tax=Pleurodeles waltl TaxID=8319 RepID=A0AAV7LB31_PLEWA|nr:hypothetical protein NDU88_001986 [Pleurodeles waltl]